MAPQAIGDEYATTLEGMLARASYPLRGVMFLAARPMSGVA